MKLLIALALAAAPSALAMAPYVPDDEGPTAAPTLIHHTSRHVMRAAELGLG